MTLYNKFDIVSLSLTKEANERNSIDMQRDENRAQIRYEDCARVQAPNICSCPGVLVDISETGCRVRFPVPIEVQDFIEYELNIQPTCKQGLSPFSLTVRAIWVDKINDSFEAGFSIIFVSESRHLKDYISALENSLIDSDELLIQKLSIE